MKSKIKVGLLFLFCTIFDMQAQSATSLEKIEGFKNNDVWGIGMTITATAVVFAALILLYLIFKLIENVALSIRNRRIMEASGLSKEEAHGMVRQSGEVYAAISMAIYEATELHDSENTILTIKNTARSYSPWSSKIYTLREIPHKK